MWLIVVVITASWSTFAVPDQPGFTSKALCDAVALAEAHQTGRAYICMPA